jgi:cardiolipin synthase A/B
MSGSALINEQVYLTSDHYFDAVIESIDQARETINVESYIFSKDALGARIASALIAASERGVSVRIIVDGVGTPFWGGHFVRKLDEVGIQSRVFHPYPWGIWQWHRAIAQSFFVFKFIYLLVNLNKRNHRKMFIIDEEILFIGSQNISQCHLSRQQGGFSWRDTGVKVLSDDVALATEAFEAVWIGRYRNFSFQTHMAKRSLIKSSKIHFNHGRMTRRRNYRRLLKNVGRANSKVWLTSAYFVPEYQLLKKLMQVAKKGIDVRILLPKYSDVEMLSWTAHYYYKALLASGVRIFEYVPQMLHAKTLLIDQQVYVGSSNLNHRSLLHDLEVDVELASKEAYQKLHQQFEEDLIHSEEINHSLIHKRPFYKRIVGLLCLYLRYIF